MSGFQELKEKLAKKAASLKPGGGKADLDNPAMAEGVNEKAYGLNRKVIYGIGLFLLCAFLSFSYMSMGDDAPEKQKKQTEEAADAGHLVNSDKQLQQMNNRAKNPNGVKPNGNSPNSAPPLEGGKGSNGTAQNNSGSAVGNENNGNASNAAGQNAANRVPAIPPRQATYSSPYPLPLMATGGTQAGAVPIGNVNQSVTEPKKDKDEYGASIAFDAGRRTDNKAEATNNQGDDSSRSGAETAGRVSAQTNSKSGGIVPLGYAAETERQAGYGGLGLTAMAYREASSDSLQPGTVIPAVLLTGINTDVGGQVLAQIESDVYDSLTGTRLLIPAGSRLVGSVAQGAKEGQSRVPITWDVLMLPGGGSYALGGSMVAADLSGFAGIPGRCHRHSGSLQRSGIFTSAVAALGSIASGNTSTNSNTYTAGQLAAQGAMSNLMNTASALIQKGIDNAGTTVTVDAGSEFMVYVTMPVRLGY